MSTLTPRTPGGSPASPAAFQEELAWRVALHYKEAHEPMSDGAFSALLEAAQEDLGPYLTHPSDIAFAKLAPVLDSYRQPHPEDEFLSNEDYVAIIAKRRDQVLAAAEHALKIDPRCTDALVVSTLLQEDEAFEALEALIDLEAQQREGQELQVPDSGSSWDDVFGRPALRHKAAIAFMATEAAFYKRALATAGQLLDLLPSDELGMRHTQALAFARLEDEVGFDELDARFHRRGSAWTNLARTVMLFKLDRMSAARRALQGFLSLNEGAAYALLHPVYVEPYLPLRPAFVPGSFEEVTLAVREADPLVVDVPEFITWVANQPQVTEQAASFARSRGYDF